MRTPISGEDSLKLHRCTHVLGGQQIVTNLAAMQGLCVMNIKRAMSYVLKLAPFDNACSQYLKTDSCSVKQVNCDMLSENPALPANIEFELETILFLQVAFQLNSDYCTKVLQEAWTVSN